MRRQPAALRHFERTAARRDPEAGQSTVVVAFAVVVLLSFLALAIDVGYLRYQRRQIQTAADAAALAGASELAYADVTAAAKADSAANGYTNGTNGVTVTVNNPPQSGPHTGDSNYVEAIVASPVKSLFAEAFGVTSTTVSARAVAHLGSGSSCVISLSPSTSSTLTADNNATVSSACGIVVESSNPNAINCGSGDTMTASYIGVVGGVKNPCTFSPAPVTGIKVPSPADPLASLPKPAVGACNFTGRQTYSPTNCPHSTPCVLNPGVYCGGIRIQSGAYVTFNPGVYILTSSQSPGGLSLDIGSYVTTNTSATPYGVTFYNTGSGSISCAMVSYTAGQGDSLIAPTTGSYQGILFFQDPGDSAAAEIFGSAADNTVFQGAYYFPDANVQIAYGGNPAYNLLDANEIEFATITIGGQTFSTTNFTNNYTSLSNGSPIKSSGGLAE